MSPSLSPRFTSDDVAAYLAGTASPSMVKSINTAVSRDPELAARIAIVGAFSGGIESASANIPNSRPSGAAALDLSQGSSFSGPGTIDVDAVVGLGNGAVIAREAQLFIDYVGAYRGNGNPATAELDPIAVQAAMRNTPDATADEIGRAIRKIDAILAG